MILEDATDGPIGKKSVQISANIIRSYIFPSCYSIGDTFRCLIVDVFARMRYGDRYFYDNQEQAGSFTGGKLIYTKSSRQPLDSFQSGFVTITAKITIYLFRSIGTN